jgi:choline-sulfatase
MRDVLDDAQAVGSDIRRAPGLDHVYAAPLPEGAAFSSSAVTRNTIAAIRDAREPFLIRASFLQPHRPAVVPEPWASRYAGIAFGVEAEETAAANEFERQFGRISRGADLAPDELDLALQMYYGAVAWLDDQIAEIMRELEDADLLESTVVIVSTDHGAVVGEARGFGKHTFAPVSHRVPFVISAPGGPRGERRADLATSEDLAATVLGLAGVTRPPMDGRDLFADPAPTSLRSAIGYGETWSRAFPNRDAGFWTDGRGWPQRACIRRNGIRLDGNTRIDGGRVDLDGPDADLFLADSRTDPAERRNHVADGRYADALESMLGELREAQSALEEAETLSVRVTPGQGFGAV